jgi:ABC-type branched-subunit amino acid transport system ATPase component
MIKTLSCSNLWKSFGGLKALAGLSLDFPPSGVVAIVGPNGAGKTTLFNVLTGYLPPDRGLCMLGAREISALPPYQIARLGITRTFQDLRLIFSLSALDNVLLSMRNFPGESLIGAIFGLGNILELAHQGTAQSLLESVGLGTKMNNSASALSYGQQKLLSLACCLAQRGDILLLDEPLAGVHPETIARIISIMRVVGHEQGKLLVFIEHNMSAVLDVADHVIVLDQGSVLAQGQPSEVLARPEIFDAYVR